MFKIDSEGATVDNKFTEGDPALSVPATVVSDEWLNSVQAEIIKVIEENDITLNKLDETQLNQAIIEFYLRGGSKAPIQQALTNNAGPLDVAGLEFDSSLIVAKSVKFIIERKTDTQNVQEAGEIFIVWDSADSVWRLSAPSSLDDSGVTFSAVIESGTNFKLQYTTDDLTGATYSGLLTITDIKEFRV